LLVAYLYLMYASQVVLTLHTGTLPLKMLQHDFMVGDYVLTFNLVRLSR